VLEAKQLTKCSSSYHNADLGNRALFLQAEIFVEPPHLETDGVNFSSGIEFL
jgi:hypothetical protein